MSTLIIKQIREKKNLSKEYIAIEMEISLNEYNKIEAGQVDLKLSKFSKLVKALRMENNDFFLNPGVPACVLFLSNFCSL
jgi:transcriptional regulator with XRE-family HTH domain